MKVLEPFQEVGAAFLASRHHALLADEPGLGKTLQAIEAAQLTGCKNNLVICPASVRLNWKKEITECLGSTEGWEVRSYNEITAGATVRNSYYDCLIMDEAHFLKNLESKRTLAVLGNSGVSRRAGRKYALTGTPILNRPRELYPLVKVLCGAFADYSYARYTQEFCGAFFDGYGVNTKGATNLGKLSDLLRGFMLRRTKREAFPGRREPLVHRIPLGLVDSDLAAVRLEEEVIGAREAKLSPTAEDFSQLGDTSRLLRLTGLAKVLAVFAFVEDLLETVEKVVVFAHHRMVIEHLEARFKATARNPVVYHGGMTDGQKAAAIANFQSSSSRVFIGQRIAAGVGINGLQEACSTVVIAEPSWVPGETQQMIDRLDRMGQEEDLVTAYILYAPRTLEEVVVHVHDSKKHVIKRILPEGRHGSI